MDLTPDLKVKDLRKYRLMVGVPMFGGNCNGLFAQSMMQLTKLCEYYGIHMEPYYLFNESLITRARNYCADVFMRSDCTHLMFIDADIGFNPQSVIELLALQQTPAESPYDIIGGAYPNKNISWEKIKIAVDKGFADENPNELANFVGDYVFNAKDKNGFEIGKPVEVLEIGTGFMMIRRSTFEKFRDAFPQYSYRPDHVRTKDFDGSRKIMQYFQAEIDQLDFGAFYNAELQRLAAGIGENATPADYKKEIEAVIAKSFEINSHYSNRYLSEDFWICQRIQRIGLKIYLCPWMTLKHVGTYVFEGSLQHLAALGVSATADASQLVNTKK